MRLNMLFEAANYIAFDLNRWRQIRSRPIANGLASQARPHMGPLLGWFALLLARQ